MRTTLTIDQDVAVQVEEQRKREGHSLKRVINTLLREGLQAQATTSRPTPYLSRTFDLRLQPGIDPAKLNQVADELEADAYRERETARRS